MDFEKIVHSKTYNVFDWLYRLIILNLLIIVTSIGVITILPAFVAGYLTIKDFAAKKDRNIFKTFFSNFALKFKPAVITNFVLLVTIFMFGLSLLHYADAFSEGTNIFFVIGFGFIIFSILLVFLMSLHLVPVIAHFHFKVWDIIKFSFYMSVKYIATTFIIILIWFLSIFSLWLNFTIPIWVMMGISGSLFIIYRFTNPLYGYLQSNRGNVVDEDIKIESEEK